MVGLKVYDVRCNILILNHKDKLTRQMAGPGQRVRSGLSRSVVKHEGDHHVDPEGRDCAVRAIDALFLDPGAFDVAQGVVGAGEALADGILEPFFRRGRDLGDACNGHGFLLGLAGKDQRAGGVFVACDGRSGGDMSAYGGCF